jgi:hypothetical protein
VARSPAGAAKGSAAPAAGSVVEMKSWPWYVAGVIVGTALLWMVLHLVGVGGMGVPGSRRGVLVRGVIALAGASAVVAIVACFVEMNAKQARRLSNMAKQWSRRAKDASRRKTIMQEEVGVGMDEPVPHNTQQALGEESGEYEPSSSIDAADQYTRQAGAMAGSYADVSIPRPPPSLEETLDEEHDLAASLAEVGDPMVGGTRSSSFATRVMPRRLEATKRWLRAEEDSRASELAEEVSYEGMRRFEESTLFAKEAYKTHQYDEPGEGFVGHYVEPTLDNYDMAFQAYSSKPFIPRRERLSNNAPIHF